MTLDIHPYYGITVLSPEEIGPGRWRVCAEVFRRDTQKDVDVITAEGTGRTALDTHLRVVAMANILLRRLPIPQDWRGPEGGCPAWNW